MTILHFNTNTNRGMSFDFGHWTMSIQADKFNHCEHYIGRQYVNVNAETPPSTCDAEIAFIYKNSFYRLPNMTDDIIPNVKIEDVLKCLEILRHYSKILNADEVAAKLAGILYNDLR